MIGHRDAFSSGVSVDRPARQATEPRAKREAMSTLYHGLVVDSTFEHSENVMVSLSSCSWPAVRGVVYTIIAYCTNWHIACCYIVVVFSHIIP